MQKTPHVILLVEVSREYGRNFMRGVANYAQLHGPWTMKQENPYYVEYETSHKRRISTSPKDWLADGIIMREPKNPEKILAMDIPTIFVNYMSEHITGATNIRADSAAIGKMAAEYFLQRGFRHFAYLGMDDMFWSNNRANSFCGRIAQAGFEFFVYNQSSKKSQRLWQYEQFQVSNWLKSLPKPLALMACNDDRAEQAAMACRLAELKIPEQVAIIGVDNDEFVCNRSNPSLSSISLEVEQISYKAAELLDKMMMGKKITPRVLKVRPGHIVTRRSTDILAVDDKEVALALRYICDNASQVIQTTDVAGAVGLSRRSLFSRFQKALGVSVYDEITIIRVEKICWLLVNTGLSIKEIAQKMGYRDDKHLARFFSRHKGINPTAYRMRSCSRCFQTDKQRKSAELISQSGDSFATSGVYIAGGIRETTSLISNSTEEAVHTALQHNQGKEREKFVSNGASI